MRMILALSATLALLACGETPDGGSQTAPDADGDTASGAEAAPSSEAGADTGGDANPFGQDGASEQAAAPIPSCPDEGGLTCAGALRISAVDTVLTRERNSFQVRGSLRLSNASREPLEVAFVRATPTLRLGNGAEFGGDAIRVFGNRPACRADDKPDECYAKTPEIFMLLEPGDSPTEVNFSYYDNNVETGLIPSMADVSQATMNVALVTVDAAGAMRRRDLSVNRIPVTARVGG